jgi:hypothetical protein
MKLYAVIGTFYLYDTYSTSRYPTSNEKEILKVFETELDAKKYCKRQRKADYTEIQVVEFVKTRKK